MVSTRDLEETLPLTAPKPKFPFRNIKPEIRYSVYATIPLDYSQQQQLLADLHSDEDSLQSCRIAPGQFQHKSLRDVYEYHIRARDEDATIHPDYFITADQCDWNKAGVLMVYLDIDTEQKEPSRVIGVARGNVGGPIGAESRGINLDIANVNWEDIKYSEYRDYGGEDPLSNKRYWLTDPRTALVPTYYSTVYIWYGLVWKVLDIQPMLEPDADYYNPGESRFALRGSYLMEPDPWITIRRSHPLFCLDSERIHRKLFLVAEKEDADCENGMAIYKAKWDGDLSDFSYDPVKNELSKADRDRLMAIEPEVEFVEHVRASEALERLDALAEQNK